MIRIFIDGVYAGCMTDGYPVKFVCRDLNCTVQHMALPHQTSIRCRCGHVHKIERKEVE